MGAGNKLNGGKNIHGAEIMKSRENQYQHFLPQFLLKNFTDNSGKSHTYKCEKGIWTDHNISKTGGDNLLYGPKNNSLEKCFAIIENHVAATINEHPILDKKDEAYMKIFILLMAFRSPSKDQTISKKYKELVQPSKKISEEDISTFFKTLKNKHESQLACFEDDPETREIVNNLLREPFDDNDGSKFYPISTRELLQMLPKISRRFGVHIFECDYDLVIGETPTLSINIDTNKVKTNGEEAGLLNKKVMYWIPISYNKVVFMYTTANVVVIQDRKLRKLDVDILNYYQKKKSPFFYSRIKNIEIPKLQRCFNWVEHFSCVFEYRVNCIHGER
jgi:hypothetical protein